MKGIYLASYEALHPNYDIVYQDINNKRDLGGVYVRCRFICI